LSNKKPTSVRAQGPAGSQSSNALIGLHWHNQN